MSVDPPGSRGCSGFTILELSIVLAIIGLIAGGIMVGRDLIHAAELRSVLKDIDGFNTAVNTFDAKYNCLPGDCANATTFFGTFASCGVAGGGPLGNATCNGNGDGQVAMQSVGCSNQSTQEPFLFWQQLSLSGLIAGNYSGSNNCTGNVSPGINVPTSHLDSACYSVSYSSQVDGETGPNYPMNAHVFSLGNAVVANGTGNRTWLCNSGLYSLPAADAMSLDGKIDDGLPFTGNVQTARQLWGGPYNKSSNLPPGCVYFGDVSNIASAANVYDATTPQTACELFFKATF